MALFVDVVRRLDFAKQLVLVLSFVSLACVGAPDSLDSSTAGRELDDQLKETAAELDLVRAEIAEAGDLAVALKSEIASKQSHKSPSVGATSLYVDKDAVVDIGTRDIQGGPQQIGKRLSVDDILYGYEILYEERQLFGMQRWLGTGLQQDPSDAFAIQDFLWTERPDTMIEFGTFTGGSAVFFADIMTAYNPNAHVITLDVQSHRDHTEVPASSSRHWGTTVHPIVGYPGSSDVRRQVEELLRRFNSSKIFLMEDSFHVFEDVLSNLVAYQDLVSHCGWILIQDTRLARMYGHGGPIKAQREFVKRYPEFQLRRTYEYLLYTQHPQGWLQRGRWCPDRRSRRVRAR